MTDILQIRERISTSFSHSFWKSNVLALIETATCYFSNSRFVRRALRSRDQSKGDQAFLHRRRMCQKPDESRQHFDAATLIHRVIVAKDLLVLYGAPPRHDLYVFFNLHINPQKKTQPMSNKNVVAR
jgi:hypothetical protein